MRWIRVLRIACILLLGLSPPGWVQPVTQVESLRVEDLRDDAGGAVAVCWASTEAELEGMDLQEELASVEAGLARIAPGLLETRSRQQTLQARREELEAFLARELPAAAALREPGADPEALREALAGEGLRHVETLLETLTAGITSWESALGAPARLAVLLELQQAIQAPVAEIAARQRALGRARLQTELDGVIRELDELEAREAAILARDGEDPAVIENLGRRQKILARLAEINTRTYVVQAAEQATGPWRTAARVPAASSYRGEASGSYRIWTATPEEHMVEVTIATALPGEGTLVEQLAAALDKPILQAMLLGLETDALQQLKDRLALVAHLPEVLETPLPPGQSLELPREELLDLLVTRLLAVAPKPRTREELEALGAAEVLKILQEELSEQAPAPEGEPPLYHFRLEVLDAGQRVAFTEPVAGRGKGNWLSLHRAINLFLFLVLGGLVLYYISHARKGKDIFLRRIPGLDALDEAIGRATEMGRPLFYLTGRLGYADNEKSISTVAATIILGNVAERIAGYDAELRVPHTDPIVYAVCTDVTKEAYLKAGRPDAYKEDSNFYLTQDQFAYTAAVNGLMLREKPAAVVYFGYYYAESLLLAETGNMTGAIQVAGTDAEHQLPFFFAACDYTLIGEELYAASAYLSREPVLLGSLRAQDLGKMLILALLVVSSVLVTCGWTFVQRFFEAS